MHVPAHFLRGTVSQQDDPGGVMLAVCTTLKNCCSMQFQLGRVQRLGDEHKKQKRIAAQHACAVPTSLSAAAATSKCRMR